MSKIDFVSRVNLYSNSYKAYRSNPEKYIILEQIDRSPHVFNSENVEMWHEKNICDHGSIVDFGDCPRCTACGKKVML